MTEEEIKKFYALCDASDIRKFTKEELESGFTRLKKEILIGLRRKNEGDFSDGGLKCLNTSIKPIVSKDFEKIPSGTKVAYGSYAGTNWITGLATKIGDKIVEHPLTTKSFSDKSARVLSSPQEFGKLIGDLVINALKKVNNTDDIECFAISFGSEFFPLQTKYGRDAIFINDYLAKNWSIKKGKGMKAGECILNYLKFHGLPHMKKIYFANDTTAVALDISSKFESDSHKKYSSLPCGFVMGTGDNGGAVFRGFKDNNIINLECGQSLSLGADKILERMIQEDLTPTKGCLLEYYMGGDYLLSRLTTSLFLLKEANFDTKNYGLRLKKYASDAKITSRLAAADISAQELSELIKTKVNLDDIFVLNEVAKRILNKGGQAAGVMIAGVCDIAGWGAGVYGAIPVEGTVFLQAFGFRDRIRKTLKILIPQHRLIFIPGSGTRGIATEAMIRQQAGS
ncbi:hypothetical protein HY030_03505 [Candidatus Gottesmanbacteria bacterium]|nr:hypothetical protein [Candidatus Gottesmanbacteria bacterium]